VQDFIKLWAAVYELLFRPNKKNNAENNTAFAFAGSNYNLR